VAVAPHLRRQRRSLTIARDYVRLAEAALDDLSGPLELQERAAVRAFEPARCSLHDASLTAVRALCGVGGRRGLTRPESSPLGSAATCRLAYELAKARPLAVGSSSRIRTAFGPTPWISSSSADVTFVSCA